MTSATTIRILAAALVAATMAPAPTASAAEASCPTGWEVESMPSPGAVLNSMNGVAVVSDSDAWAAGWDGYIDGQEFVNDPVLLHWDGQAWGRIPLGPGRGQLADVVAIAPDDVWAVGHSGNEDFLPLTLHWDGVTWHRVPSPPIERGYLLDVSASGPNDVWAVGIVTGTFETIVQRWDGTSWTLVDHPSPGNDYFNLGSVLALAPDDVWIAGNFLGPRAEQVPFSAHWNGQQWRTFPMVKRGTAGTLIDALAASADGRVWAVGSATSDEGTSRPLAELFEAGAWRVAATPIPSSFGALLGASGVRQGMWAVGWQAEEGGSNRTLTMRLTPRGWRTVPSPSVGNSGNLLLDVAALDSGETWAVGFFQVPGMNRNLALHRCA
jgi:hypothetical protein